MKLPAQQPAGDIAAGGPAKEGLRRAAGLDGALSWPAFQTRTLTGLSAPSPPYGEAGEGGAAALMRSRPG